MATQNKAAQQALNRQAAEGAKDNLKGTVQFGGESYKVSDLVDVLQAPAAASTATDRAKAAYTAAVASERAARLKARTTRAALQNYIVGIHGESNTLLAEFGFKVKKQPAKTVEVKAGAAEKMRATRKARGTMGPKQKAKVKGTVEIDATALAALQNAAETASAATTTTAAQTTANVGGAKPQSP